MAGRDRITQLDGLRAIAFLAVFAHHAVALPLGWLGVDLFFVLSGFLITRNLLDLAQNNTVSSSLAAFFFRRALRIIPPYYLAITVIMLVEQSDEAYPLWYYAFASNIHDVISGQVQGGGLRTMWSIAVEEQFYVVWPWLILLISRRRLLGVFALLILAAPIVRMLFQNVDREAVYRLMPCRMDLLAAGAVLAYFEAQDRRWIPDRRRALALAASLAGALFIALTVAIPSFRSNLNETVFNILGYSLSMVCFAGLLGYVAGTDRGIFIAALRHPILRYIGMISYMGYLVHVFALKLIKNHLNLGKIPTAAIGLALTLGIATLSWYAMENPLQRLRHRVRPTPLTTRDG